MRVHVDLRSDTVTRPTPAMRAAMAEAEVGDVVTFFGRNQGGEIPLEEVANHATTINYEVLTGLTQRLPRIWTDHGGY